MAGRGRDPGVSGPKREEREKRSEETQTTPKGVKIPIPERAEFFKNLEKIAPPKKPPKI